MTAIRKHALDFGAIVGLVVIALAVAAYTLAHQRVRFPLIQAKQFQLKGDFATAQAVTPGQGQTIRVSGVKIGDISKVALQDGHAVVTFEIDPQYKKLVHTDATALLRPKTGLKDMFVELNPGSDRAPVAAAGWTIPIQSTLPDINPDEILAGLDSDSRDYLQLLVQGLGQGLKGRGHDLQEVFRRFEPTHRDLARVTTAVAQRHTSLKRLIDRLALLNGALAGKSDQLSQLVSSSADVFKSFASEESSISQAVGDLPGALQQTTQTLGKVQRFADVLGPATEQLRPAVRSLNTANKAVTPFAVQSAPIVEKQIRPFVRAARPVVRSLKPTSDQLATATPDLTRSFTVLNHLFNMVGYNPNGREGPSVATRDEGFLFWIAWLDHDGGALTSVSDANGTFRPITVASNCSTLKQLLTEEGGTGGNALYNLVFGAPVFDSAVCGSPPTVPQLQAPAKATKARVAKAQAAKARAAKAKR